VFRGYDPDHDRVVAIKALLLDLTPEQAIELAADLDRLSSITIDHPFIILPLGAGAAGSTVYVVEEYFVADSADVALKQYGPAPLPDALRLIGQLAGALDAAAAAGVHHGSLHPRDVLVAPHEVRLTGLGIVPALERVGFRAQVRRPYAAPERMAGGPITGASDVFSLACIAFELIAGHRPVPSGEAVIVDTSAIRSTDAAALAEVFARVLSGTPEDRHPSALAFAAALKHALTGAPLHEGAEVEFPRPRRPRRRAAPEPDAPRLPSFLEAYETDVSPDAGPSTVETVTKADAPPEQAAEPPAPVAAVEREVPVAVFEAAPEIAQDVVAETTHDEPTLVEVVETEPLDTVLLRTADPVSDMGLSDVPMFTPDPVESSPVSAVAVLRRHIVLLLVVLAVTFALGFTVGYFAAPLGADLARPAAATPVAAAGAGPAPTVAPPPPPPASSIDKPAAAETKPAEPAAAATAGRLVVTSRPSGARILVDGRAVGSTPMTLRALAPGLHAIRLELAGYRAWSSDVRVTAGRQRRIAASLERRPGR
jgi:serine/threonine protein kinase